MDKISKRSKGYAFIEYTTEEAASAALKEMNGKVNKHEFYLSLSPCCFLICHIYSLCLMQIINGWMIVVDVAKPSPRRYGGNRSRP